jgi:hypothetical protein
MVHYSEPEKNSYFTKNPDPGGSGLRGSINSGAENENEQTHLQTIPRDLEIANPYTIWYELSFPKIPFSPLRKSYLQNESKTQPAYGCA